MLLRAGHEDLQGMDRLGFESAFYISAKLLKSGESLPQNIYNRTPSVPMENKRTHYDYRSSKNSHPSSLRHFSRPARRQPGRGMLGDAPQET